MVETEYCFLLNENGINECKNILSRIPEEYYTSKNSRTAFLFSVDSIFEQYLEFFNSEDGSNINEDKDITLRIIQNRGSMQLNFYIPGKKFDPTDVKGEKESFYSTLSHNLNKFFNNKLEYSYTNSINTVSMELRKNRKNGILVRELIVLMASAVFTILGMLLPETFRNALLPSIDIVANTTINIVKMSASFAIFFMTIDGVRSCGNVNNIVKYGKSILDNALIKFCVGFAAIIAFIFSSGMTVSFNTGVKGESIITSVFSTISGIFPTSFITPFVQINFLQIIILGFVIGLALLTVGGAVGKLGEIVHDAQLLSGRILVWCSGLLSVYVFCQIPSFVWGGKQNAFFEAVHMLLIILAIYLVMYGIYLVWMSISLKEKTIDLVKELFPTFYRGFMTRSSAVCFPEIQENVEDLGVDHGFANFATPLSFILCRSYHFVTIFILLVFLLKESAVSISVVMLAQLVLSSLLISIASPPIPGGTIISVSILAAVFGVPDSNIALAAPIVLVTNYVVSGLRSADIAMHTILSAKECNAYQIDLLQKD